MLKRKDKLENFVLTGEGSKISTLEMMNRRKKELDALNGDEKFDEAPIII